MPVQTILKLKQNRLLSKTWRTILTAKEIEKNSYHITGDMKKARAFALAAAMYEAVPYSVTEIINEPIVIYSREMEENKEQTQNLLCR